MIDTIITDPQQHDILAEVRRIKEDIAAEHDYDIDRIIATARKAQEMHPERIVTRETPKQNPQGSSREAGS